MTQTQGLETLFGMLLEEVAPQLRGRLIVEASQQQKLFVAAPRGSRVVLTFGRQACGRPDLMSIIEEAAASAEALLYGTTMAVALRLDADQRWAYDQRQLPCSD